MFGSSASATFALSAIAKPSRVNVTNLQRIGKDSTTTEYPSANSPYACSGLIADGASFVVDLADNDTSASDSWTPGTAQVTTATAGGVITQNGSVEVTVTSAAITVSPKEIFVPVLVGDTPAEWAEKVRNALQADLAISDLFTVSGSGNEIVLTTKPIQTFTVGESTVNFYSADDATLNIALDGIEGMSVTPAPTSADTTAGVATTGVFVSSGSSEDFEGNNLNTLTKICGLLIEVVSGDAVTVSSAAGLVGIGAVAAPFNGLLDFSDAGKSPDVITIESTAGPAEVRVTVLGGTA